MATMRRRKPNVNSKLENLAQIDKFAQNILDNMLDNQELIDFATKHVLQRLRHDPDNSVICNAMDVEEFPSREHILEDSAEEQLYYSMLTDVNNMVLQRALYLNSQNILLPPSPSVVTGDGNDEQTFEEFEGEDHGY